MAQKLEPKEIVDWQEFTYSNMMEQEALLRLLVKKGIISKEEFIKELEEVHLDKRGHL